MKKLIIIFFTMVVLLILFANIVGKGWIFFHDGPYRGKVVDVKTGQPIEGAVVAAMWSLDAYGGPAGPITVYCDAQETATDKNGEFVVPKAFCFNLWPFTTMELARFVIFKPGYLGYPPVGSTFEERKAKMPDFAGGEFRYRRQYNIIKLGRPITRQERISTLHEAESLIDDEIIKKLTFLVKLTNSESKSLGLGERPLK